MGMYTDTHGAVFGGSSDSELMHHGILGQKWYRRRFQNEDGTLTEAGKRRYLSGGGKTVDISTGKSVSGTSKSKSSDTPLLQKLMEKNIKAGKDKAPINAVESMTKDATNIATNAGNLVKAVNKNKAKQEPITMTDEELRKAINRLNLERQYRDLTSSMTSSGMQKAQEILETVGPAVGIASGLVGIASTLYKLKHDDENENENEYVGAID